MAAPDVRKIAAIRSTADMRQEVLPSVAPLRGVVSGQDLRLTWQAVLTATGYRATITPGNGIQQSKDVSSTEANFTNLPAGTVTAKAWAKVNGTWQGEASWQGTVQAPLPPDPPDPPDPDDVPTCGKDLRVAANIRACLDLRGGSGPDEPGEPDVPDPPDPPGPPDPDDPDDPHPDEPGSGAACGGDIRATDNIRVCSDIRSAHMVEPDEPGGPDNPGADGLGFCAANIRAVSNIRLCPDVRGWVPLPAPQEASLGLVQIWNMALGYIGTCGVASERENTPEARQCRLYWDSARRQALRDFPWNFAQTRVRLAPVPLPDGWQGEWRYAYALPPGCLKLHTVRAASTAERHRGAAALARPFKMVSALTVGQRGGGTICLSDEDNAIADYTRDVTCPLEWDDIFVGMLARKLSAMIAVSILKNNSQKVQELEQLYRAALPVAYEANASEQVQRQDQDSWLAAR